MNRGIDDPHDYDGVYRDTPYGLDDVRNDPPSGTAQSYVGVWDSERECWIADEDNPTQPARFNHSFFAKGMAEMWLSTTFEQQDRYEIRELPENRSNLSLSKPT